MDPLFKRVVGNNRAQDASTVSGNSEGPLFRDNPDDTGEES